MQHHLESTLGINAAADKVWQVLDDFGGVEKYSVGVEHSSIVGEKKTGLGAVRECVFYDKNSVYEEIIEYQDGENLKVVLTNLDSPLKTLHAGFRLTKINATSCEILMMDFEMKFGPLGALLGMVMIKPVLKGVQKKLLLGLAYHSVTGEVLGSELPSKEELSKVAVL